MISYALAPSKNCISQRLDDIWVTVLTTLETVTSRQQAFFDVYYRCVQVEVVQQVINSVTLLLELEERIQRGENIQDLLP